MPVKVRLVVDHLIDGDDTSLTAAQVKELVFQAHPTLAGDPTSVPEHFLPQNTASPNMTRSNTMSLDSSATLDHISGLALAQQHLDQLNDLRVSAVTRAKEYLEEKYPLSCLTPEAKMGIQSAMEIAMTPLQHKKRVQHKEVVVKSSKADARRRARHRRQGRERVKGMVDMEEEGELAIEDSIEAGIIGARHSEVKGQAETEVVALSEVLRPTTDDMEEESAATIPPKARVSEETLRSLSKDVNEVLKLTDDVEVADMMKRGPEILKMSRDPTLPIRVAPNIHPGASSESSDTEGSSLEGQGFESDDVDTHPEQKHEASNSGGPLLDEAVMKELKRSALSDTADSCEASEAQIVNGANNPSDGMVGGKPYLYRLHDVDNRAEWENTMLRKLVKEGMGWTEQHIDEWLTCGCGTPR